MGTRLKKDSLKGKRGRGLTLGGSTRRVSSGSKKLGGGGEEIQKKK